METQREGAGPDQPEEARERRELLVRACCLCDTGSQTSLNMASSSKSTVDISEEEMEKEFESMAVGAEEKGDETAVNGGYLFTDKEDIKRQRKLRPFVSCIPPFLLPSALHVVVSLRVRDEGVGGGCETEGLGS